jgi:uncharacterized small protein (DUF1192 family)
VYLLKEKLRARTRSEYGSDGQDLQLYRQLRRTESKLFTARECLRRMLAQQEAEKDSEQSAMSSSDEFEHEIDALKSEIGRLEMEYDNVQRNVRACFYQDIHSARAPDTGLAAGHAAQ